MLRIRNYFIAFAVVFAISSAYALIGAQDAKAQEGAAMTDLIKRIEALESKGGAGNVTAGKIRGLKIGFSIRHRFELRDNNGGDKTSATSDFTLQRTRINFDADVNNNVRGYVQLQDVRTWGAEQSTAGNLARVDLIQGYVDLRNLGSLSSALENISVRLGRWQMWYGNHRLLGHLNWANESRSYDGARVRYDNKKNARIDLFAFSIQEDQTGVVSGEGTNSGIGTPTRGTDQDELLWGMYSQFKPAKGLVVEPYLIIRNRSRERELVGSKAGEQRYTYGARIAGKKMASLPGVDFTFEQAWQSGRTEAADAAGSSTSIDAFAGAWGVGYTFSNVAWSPRIGYQYAFASGDDDAADGDDESFDALYPTGHARMGYLDFHAWQNIEAHKIEFSAKPTKKLLLKADFWFFDNNEENDAWYTVGGAARGGNSAAENKLGNTNRDDEYGQELDITIKYKLLKNFGVVAGYSHYFIGDFIEDSVNGGVNNVGPGSNNDSDTDWFYLQTTMKF
ncbi:MAG: alginate export family protein [Candidatus Scalindua sp.]